MQAGLWIEYRSKTLVVETQKLGFSDLNSMRMYPTTHPYQHIQNALDLHKKLTAGRLMAFDCRSSKHKMESIPKIESTRLRVDFPLVLNAGDSRSAIEPWLNLQFERKSVEEI